MDNEFMPQDQSPEKPKPKANDQITNHDKDALGRKRRLIEEELKGLMSKVNQYQVERSLLSGEEGTEKAKPKAVLVNQNRLLGNLEKHGNNQRESLDMPKTERTVNNKTPIAAGKLDSEDQKDLYRNKPKKSKSTNHKPQEITRGITKLDLQKSGQKEKYKNYLPQIDFKTPLPNKVPNEQKKRQNIKRYLQSAQALEKDTIRRVNSLRKGKGTLNYNQYTAVEKEIDDIFVKCLKVRLECALKL